MNFIVIQSPNTLRTKNVQEQFAAQSIKVGFHWIGATMMDPARYGISKSHKRCVRMAKESGWSSVTIIEDDIQFIAPISIQRYLDVLKRLPDDWDLFLGGIHSGEVTEPDTDKGYSLVKGQFSGLHMYTVPQRYYDTFLSADESINIDYVLSAMLKAKTYCAYPILVKEIPGFSYNAGKDVNYGEYLCKNYRCI